MIPTESAGMSRQMRWSLGALRSVTLGSGGCCGCMLASTKVPGQWFLFAMRWTMPCFRSRRTGQFDRLLPNAASEDAEHGRPTVTHHLGTMRVTWIVVDRLTYRCIPGSAGAALHARRCASRDLAMEALRRLDRILVVRRTTGRSCGAQTVGERSLRDL